jgi:hypothetical protein
MPNHGGSLPSASNSCSFTNGGPKRNKRQAYMEKSMYPPNAQANLQTTNSITFAEPKNEHGLTELFQKSNTTTSGASATGPKAPAATPAPPYLAAHNYQKPSTTKTRLTHCAMNYFHNHQISLRYPTQTSPPKWTMRSHGLRSTPQKFSMPCEAQTHAKHLAPAK